MATYNYFSGKERVDAILNNKLEIFEKDIPSDNNFTFENGYCGWVTAIFVDIRDSSTLFTDEDSVKVAKIVRSFTSEIIEILRNDDNLREVGIRGDCVYAVYSSPNKSNEYELADKTFYINTYLRLLNKLLQKKNYPTIKAGVGMSTAQELVIKAGRKDVGINNKVWIGSAVTKASNLSALGNKNGISSLVYSGDSYAYFIDELVKVCGEEARTWFEEGYDRQNGTYYHSEIIKTDFNNWINSNV